MGHDLPMPRLTEVCADEVDTLALAVVRFVAAGYMTGDTACWDAGHECAERALGPVLGPRLVACMTGVMRALRAERAGDWHFMPATCCRVTADECLLAQALAVARRRDRQAISGLADQLAGGEPAPRLTMALEECGEALTALARALEAGRAPEPALASATIH